MSIKIHSSMRGHFAYYLYKQMKKDKDIWLVVNDLGYKMWDDVRRDFPDRFINVGAAEQAMIGVAIGLALSGKKPVVYSITTFLLYRPFETLRNYIHYEKIPVKLVGGGRDRDYAHDGISHWAEEDKKVMKILNNIKSVWPESNKHIQKIIEEMLSNDLPWYINLRR